MNSSAALGRISGVNHINIIFPSPLRIPTALDLPFSLDLHLAFCKPGKIVYCRINQTVRTYPINI